MATNFYKCPHCGNVVIKMVDSGLPLSCCGEEMLELKPNSEDASTEKHVPVVTKIDDCHIRVKVGSAPHPMTEDHHIEFVYVETLRGGINVRLAASPEADICVCAKSLCDSGQKQCSVKQETETTKQCCEKNDKMAYECNDAPLIVYDYCNLHGLWHTEL